MIRAVVFDLDGVVRRFDPGHVSRIELRHGLAPGTINEVAFSRPLLDWVTSGRLSRSAWVSSIGEEIGSAEAAAEWGMQPSRVDRDVLSLVGELRALGYATAILTNGTDAVPRELATSGLLERFDVIFNSATIGFAKPDVRAFDFVLRGLELVGPEVFFVDDSAENLVGAVAVGMTAELFSDVQSLRTALIAAGVSVRA